MKIRRSIAACKTMALLVLTIPFLILGVGKANAQPKSEKPGIQANAKSIPIMVDGEIKQIVQDTAKYVYPKSNTETNREEEAYIAIDTTGVNAIPFNGQPLFVIDGKIYDPNTSAPLDPNRVKKVKVLKGIEAYKKYGKRGAFNGVVEITTIK